MMPSPDPAGTKVRTAHAGAAVVLVAAAEHDEQERLMAALPESYTAIAVASAHEGELVIASGGVGVVVAAADLADMPGVDWLGQLRRRNVSAMRLFAPARSSEALAIASVNVAGVFRYVQEPAEPGRLARAVADAIEVSGHRSGPPCMREAVAKVIKAHTLCRESREGCLVAAQLDNAPPPEGFLRRLSGQIGWTGIGLLSLMIFTVVALGLGVGVFTLIYLFKSMMGIDLVSDMHLGDFLHEILRR